MMIHDVTDVTCSRGLMSLMFVKTTDIFRPATDARSDCQREKRSYHSWTSARPCIAKPPWQKKKILTFCFDCFDGISAIYSILTFGSIWHSYPIFYPTFYLAFFLTFLSDILFVIQSGIISEMYSDTLIGILLA